MLRTSSLTISKIRCLAAWMHSCAPLRTTRSLCTPDRGKLMVTAPHSSEIRCSTSPRLVTKCLWCLGSTCMSSSTMLSCNKHTQCQIRYSLQKDTHLSIKNLFCSTKSFLPRIIKFKFRMKFSKSIM